MLHRARRARSPRAPTTPPRPGRRRRGRSATRRCWPRSTGCTPTRQLGPRPVRGPQGVAPAAPRRRHRRRSAVACTVERLMRAAGLRGAPPGPPVRHHPAGPAAASGRRTWSTATSPPTAPNQLWVVDFTYVPTWSGMAFTAFVSDVFSRRIVGWRTAAVDAHRAAAGRPGDGAVDPGPGPASEPARRADPPLRRRRRSTPRSATPTGSPTPARSPRSAPSATATTTRWPSR